jgi:hypothetical protein
LHKVRANILSGNVDYSIFVNRVIKKYLVEITRTAHISRSANSVASPDYQRGVCLWFAVKRRRTIMIDKTKTKLALIATVAALGIAMPAAAMAQSAYTTGSAASRAAAGYSSPYGGGGGLYDYAPGYGYDRGQVRQWQDRSGDYYRNGEF